MTISRVEYYGASLRQEGRVTNEDAFLLGRGASPFAVLCDGAGNAQRAAKKACRLFACLFSESTEVDVQKHRTWARWINVLDTSLLGGFQSTFLGVTFFQSNFIGTCAGDSRAYLFSRDGNLKILTETASKHRLGSGKARAFPLRARLRSGDILLLLSDGAWTPLGPYRLKKVLPCMLGRHFSEVPQAILEAASRTGRADDMAAVAVRLVP